MRAAAASSGWFYVTDPLFTANRCREAIADASAFFDLPLESKKQIAIERSPHFRGYSQMCNERDWREQIHFGREEAAGSHQLSGPNLWPPDALWRRRILALLGDFERVAREILTSLFAPCLSVDEDPYLLLKLIHYLAPPDQIPRPGVAPHVDFSFITLVLQNDSGGLEFLNPTGLWVPAAPLAGTLIVNVGEILEFVSGGRFRATPHRVVNHEKARISLPFFFNPGLEQKIAQLAGPWVPRAADPEHVHRVFEIPPASPFVFGDAEWRRKGLGRWCASCVV